MSGPRLTVAEPILPEKEPINFDVHLRGAPEEVVQLVQNIKEVGEQFLYHWKTFQIVLPPPIITTGSPPPPSTGDNPFISGNNDGNCTLSRRSQKQLKVRNLFVIPSFDELDSVAVDSKGEPRRLTGKQLESLRERGEFEVASINFAGQKHRWQLSEWLQKGTERSRETLLDDLALALRFTLVTARARLISHFFSVSQSLKALLVGFLKLLDITIGVPSLQALNLDTKLREERCRYLVAELVCRPEYEQSLELLCSFVRKQMRRAATEKFEVSREAAFTPVRVPYLFFTPKGVELDLRLFSHDLMKRALPILVQILERETRGWFLHFRERLITELRSQKLPDEEIEKEVNQAVMKEYLQRVYNSILSNSDLKALGEGIPELLVQQAQSVVLMHRAVENVRNKLAKTKDTLRQRLEYNHPVLSRISPWLRNRLSVVESKFIEECQWSAHEEALSLCTNQHLHQTLYFLHRDLIFMREREPVLKKELKKVKSPTRTFQWLTQIWLPTNWIVRRHFQGQSEVIPTKLSSTATSITTPRSDPSQAVFLVEKEIVRTTTTRWPFWRWINYCHRTWSWTWNAMFFFGVVVPWCSPVSIRALFCTEPFYPDLELSQLNGTLFPRKSSLTPTLLSRLLTLWRHISKSRTQFETKPDTGFIGKGMTRHVDRLWNYLVKGLFGTICIVFMLPIVCVVASIASLLVALTAVLWMPIVTVCMHILMALVYDADSPDETRNRYCIIAEALILDVFVKGCLQPMLALFVAVFICPLLSVSVLTIGLLRYWFRLAWDAVMYRVVIKKRGRVPACDSFVVRRVAGPGLTNDYYYQIKPEQALAAFEAKLELDELEAYKHQMEQIILQPQKDYSQFVKACFGPFSAQLAKVGAYRGLEKEAQDLTQILHEKIEKRERILQTGLSPQVRAKVKLNTIDLKIAVQQAALILERFYPDHVLRRLAISEEEFWDSKGLSPNDWPGLATLMYADVFNLDFLTPLDESDTVFKLEPEHGVDMGRFSEVVRNAEVGAGCLDLLGPVYAPRGNIQIHSPYLEVSAFNPRSKYLYNTTKKLEKKRDTFTSSTMWLRHKRATPKRQTEDDYSLLWRPWKRRNAAYSAEKMQIPLPVPHPAHIAIIIHNRDNDHAISLDSTTCKYILKVLEDCSEENLDVNRYRGGGGEDNSLDSINSLSSLSESPEERSSQDRVDVVDVVDNNFSLKHSVVTTPIVATEEPSAPFNWRHSEWTTSNVRRKEATVRVDLASPEDITLDSDSSRVMFSIYGTTV